MEFVVRFGGHGTIDCAKGERDSIMKTNAPFLVLVCVTACLAAPPRSASAADAREIIEQTSVRGGLVVHLGCGDGRFTAALHVNDRYVVHGLDTDMANVEKARTFIQSLGPYGPVSADSFDGVHLPYVDNLVNLVVAEKLGDVTMDEVMRVLAPHGVAYLKRDGSWMSIVKPRPTEIDEWTHYLHDATNNAVADDALVGPPGRVQWKAGPTFARHHDVLASVTAAVSTGGRIFYIIDEAPTSLMSFPPDWHLVARDAFNGTLLWKRPIPTWANYLRPFRSGPPQLPRRLVARDDAVYVTLGLDAPLVQLDAATGETRKTYQGTEGTDEILLCDGVLVLVVFDPAVWDDAKVAGRRGVPSAASPRHLMAVEADSGKVLWHMSGDETAGLQRSTVAAGADRVTFQAGQEVRCVELKTGEAKWRRSIDRQNVPRGGKTGKDRTAAARPKKPPKGGRSRAASYHAPTLVLSDEHNFVLSADLGRLAALDLGSGEILWSCPCAPDFHAPADVFVADGLVWAGLFAAAGRDPRTGEIQRQLDIEGLLTPGHHPRCYRNKATSRFIIADKRGMEFFDLGGDDHLRNDWVRGECQYGVMPCNGLLYIPPNPCCCYPNAQLHGFYALREQTAESRERRAGERLERGPAYLEVGSRRSEVGIGGTAPESSLPIPHSDFRNPHSEDWPSFRGGELRSGSTTTALPVDLEPLWTASIGGRLSSPVVAGNRLLVVAIDEGRVVALDADDGHQLWSFSASSRVDTPPTLAAGLAIFGCNDGRVYCLHAADGSLAWRYRAAPDEKYIVVDNRLESVWPVHGSVLVKDGVAYAAAGRSVFLDGGVYLCGLDLQTGRLRCQARVNIDPQEARSKAFIMDGVRPDVLVSDGKHIYLQHVQFDSSLTPTGGKGRHILATSGLADNSWFYRTFWRLGLGDYENDFPPSYVKHRFAVPWGQLLAFDDRRVCGLKTHMSKGISPGTAVQNSSGCLLFGNRNMPFSPDAETLETDFPRGTGAVTHKAIAGPAAAESEWTTALDYQARAMVLARRGEGSSTSQQDELLFVAGWSSHENPDDMRAAIQGRKEGLLEVYNAATGKRLAIRAIASAPIFDGMAAAGGRLFISLKNGTLQSLGSDKPAAGRRSN